MIVRPFTLLTGLMFAFSGAYLFVVKHQSQSLEDRLGQLAQTSRADEQAIRVLKAQWALEADPTRIAALAAEFTQLKPMKPSQLVTLASLASSLPAPGSPVPYSNPEDLVPEMPGATNGMPAPATPAIQVHGHDVADATAAVQAGANAKGTAREAVADNQTIVAPLPAPPPIAPPHAAPALHPAVRLAAVHHETRSWIEPIPRRERPARRAPSVAAPSIARSYVVQTRAEGETPHPLQPLGAQIVRIKAVAHAAPPVVHHEISSETPLNGGSLLGMAQSGSRN